MAEDKAAFGVFPQLKRKRSKQDPEAAKNVPIDLARGALSGVLGAPGDIESLIRLLPGLSEETVLPTSEDIEKRLPFKSDTPVSRAATGLGQLGGGFYTGPGSPLRAVGALPKAIKHGAQEFSKASVAGAPHVIKPRGGNWLTGSVERSVQPLKVSGGLTPKDIAESEAHLEKILPKYDLTDPRQAREIQDMKEHIAVLKRNRAVDDWIERNLTNYIKKDMGTPEDPVRKLAEEGVLHITPENVVLSPDTAFSRQKMGYPRHGLAQSQLATDWEILADSAIYPYKAADIQATMNLEPKIKEANAKMQVELDKLNKDFDAWLRSKPDLDEKDIAALNKMRPDDKAQLIGNTSFMPAMKEAQTAELQRSSTQSMIAQNNPWIAKVDPETPLYSGGAYDLGFDHVIDVLKQDLAEGRIRPEQLNKVSMEQAVRRTYEYDQEMAKKMREAQIKATEGMPVHKEYPEGYRWIELKAKEPETLPEGVKRVQQSATQGGLDVPGYGFIEAKWNPKTGLDWEKAERDAKKALSHKPTEEALKYEGETMGHCVGGYCPDVMEGRSRIYSLRDAKGEPHVTIETSPESVRGYEEAVNALNDEQMYAHGQLAKKLMAENPNLNYGDADRMAYEQLHRRLPERIVQIKGKQNRAPKEEYLPFVQDFVKSGQWADVGDIHNTGLRNVNSWINPGTMQEYKKFGLEVPNFATDAELEALHRQYEKLANPGMKRGGKVSISHNCDCQMMELEDKKLAIGGAITADDLILEERSL